MSGASGNYQIVSEVLLNGVVVPAHSWNVECNSYSMASALEAVVTTASSRGFAKLPDYGAEMQKVIPFPFQILLGYGRGKVAPISLEMGYADEHLDDYDQFNVTFNGRGTASIFQDIQVGDPIDRSQAGSAIIQKFFSDQGIPLTITAPSPAYAGATSGDDDDPTYTTTMRDRTIWDEMEAIAVDDGFRLTVHNGKGIYGPPGKDPVLNYDWAGDGTNVGVTALNIRHSPRRSHNMKVVVKSYLPGAKSSVSGTYGNASAKAGETFTFFVGGLKKGECDQRAQSIYYDVARKEFLVTMTVVPDETLIQMISQVGANFSVQLGGSIQPSAMLTYQVRQVRVEFSASSKTPLLCHFVMGNVNPIQSGALLS